MSFLDTVPMELEITVGLKGMKLTKDEEEGHIISVEKRGSVVEECLLSLLGRFLSTKNYDRRAVCDVMGRAWRMEMDLRIVDVGNKIF